LSARLGRAVQALDKLQLPFIVRLGVIERISITTPTYTSLLRMTGEPVVIRISGVYLLVDKSVQTPEEVPSLRRRLLRPFHHCPAVHAPTRTWCHCLRLAVQIVRAMENVKRSELNLAALWRSRQAAAAKGDADAGVKSAGWMDKLTDNVLQHLRVRQLVTLLCLCGAWSSLSVFPAIPVVLHSSIRSCLRWKLQACTFDTRTRRPCLTACSPSVSAFESSHSWAAATATARVAAPPRLLPHGLHRLVLQLTARHR
jgi:hypothetical protein